MSEAYQGTPVFMSISIKDGDSWISDFTGKAFRAICVDSMCQTVKRWSSADGTIIIGSKTVEGQTIATANFVLSVEETKEMHGKYTIECEDETENTPSIGKVKDVLLIKQSNLGSWR